jgi:hypothetical protein
VPILRRTGQAAADAPVPAGWHAEADPIPDADPTTQEQRDLAEIRADLTAARDICDQAGDLEAAEEFRDVLALLDAELAALGVRGSLEPERSSTGRRVRSTRRRQDTPDLPRREMAATTLGRTFTGNGGAIYRPSMFVTVTLPSYGRVHRTTGAPLDPATYDYARAARDAIHFPRLLGPAGAEPAPGGRV